MEICMVYMYHTFMHMDDSGKMCMLELRYWVERVIRATLSVFIKGGITYR